MESLIIESASRKDLKILSELASRLGLKVHFLDSETTEEIALINAIKEGLETPEISREEVLKHLEDNENYFQNLFYQRFKDYF